MTVLSEKDGNNIDLIGPIKIIMDDVIQEQGKN